MSQGGGLLGSPAGGTWGHPGPWCLLSMSRVVSKIILLVSTLVGRGGKGVGGGTQVS